MLSSAYHVKCIHGLTLGMNDMLEKTLDILLILLTLTIWCWIVHRVIYLLTI
jgi:hypothetical protein